MRLPAFLPGILSAILLVLASPLLADEIALRGGGKIRGVIESEDKAGIHVRVASGSIYLPRRRIESIVRESERTFGRREARDLAGQARAHIEGLRMDAARRDVERMRKLDSTHSALAGLEEAIRTEELRGEGYWKDARELLERGENRAAITAYRQWRLRCGMADTKARAVVALAHRRVGLSEFQKGRLREALDQFRASKALDGDVRRELKLMTPIAAVESIAAGRLREAERTIRTLPQSRNRHFLAALLDQVRGEHDAATAGFAKAAALADRSGDLPVAVIEAYSKIALRGARTRPPTKDWERTFLRPLRSAVSGPVTAYAPSRKLAQQVARVSAIQLRDSVAEFGGRVPTGARVQVVVHVDRSTYGGADQRPAGGAVAIGREGTAGITYPTKDGQGRDIVRVESFAGQSDLVNGIVPHEIVHVAQHFSFDAFGRAHWLDEGVAMLAESKASHEQRRAWFERSEKRFTVAELVTFRSTPQGDGLLFYCQAYLLADHVKSQGSESDWSRFLKKMATADFDEAVEAIYGGLGKDPFAR